MGRGRLSFLLALIAALLSGAAAADESEAPSTINYQVNSPARHNLVEGAVSVTVVNWVNAPSRGYAPCWVEVRSRVGVPVKVAVTARAQNGSRYERLCEVEPQSTARCLLPVPANAGSVRLEVAGDFIDGSPSQSFWLSSSSDSQVLVIGNEPQLAAFLGAPSTDSPSSSIVAIGDNELPEELSAYVGFSAVVLLGKEPFELTEGQRRVLEQYAATGGLLALVGGVRGKEQFLPLLGSQPLGREAHYGFGSLFFCGATDPACGQQLLQRASAARAPVEPQGTQQSHRGGLFRLYNAGSSSAALLPQATPPVGRFLLIMLAFSLLVGPGSYLLSRRKGPLVALLTIPGVALLTSLALAGNSILFDGFQVHATTRALTLLDRKGARAITVGLAAFYANLSPGEARFSSSSAVLLPEGEQSSQRSSILWEGGPVFRSDFIPSRTYREWAAVSVQPSRARLQVKPGQSPTLLNGLGATIDEAYLRWNGHFWVARQIPDGQEGALIADPDAELQKRGIRMELLGADRSFSDRFPEPLLGRLVEDLPDSGFIARLSGPWLMPLGGISAVHQEDVHYVRGEVE